MPINLFRDDTVTFFASLFFVFVLNNMAPSAANAQGIPKCTPATTLATIFSQTGSNECSVTPDKVDIDIYQFGVCTSEPSVTDTSNCDFFLNNSSPTTLNLTAGASGTLAGATLAEIGQKNYTHLVLVMGNAIKFATTFEFSIPQLGFDGASGLLCWTNGQSNGFLTPAASDNSITCGSNPSPTLTTYSYPYFGVSGNYLITENLSGKGNSYTLVEGPVPSNVATSDGGSNYIHVRQNMPTSLDLRTADLANLVVDISFKVTDAAKLTFHEDPVAGIYCATASTPCVGNIEVNFIDILISSP